MFHLYLTNHRLEVESSDTKVSLLSFSTINPTPTRTPNTTFDCIDCLLCCLIALSKYGLAIALTAPLVTDGALSKYSLAIALTALLVTDGAQQSQKDNRDTHSTSKESRLPPLFERPIHR